MGNRYETKQSLFDLGFRLTWEPQRSGRLLPLLHSKQQVRIVAQLDRSRVERAVPGITWNAAVLDLRIVNGRRMSPTAYNLHIGRDSDQRYPTQLVITERRITYEIRAIPSTLKFQGERLSVPGAHIEASLLVGLWPRFLTLGKLAHYPSLPAIIRPIS